MRTETAKVAFGTQIESQLYSQSSLSPEGGLRVQIDPHNRFGGCAHNTEIRWAAEGVWESLWLDPVSPLGLSHCILGFQSKKSSAYNEAVF